MAPRKIRGRLLEIDAPSAEEREYIFEELQKSSVHVPFGCKEPPPRVHFDAGLLELHRGAEVRREAVRYHILRRLEEGRPIGFFLDFGWDHATDPIREIDLTFPDPKDRGVGTYVDATVLIGFYLFANNLAKRVRWRVEVKEGQSSRRGLRQGARLISEFEERHPLTGEWVKKNIYEFAYADYEALLKQTGANPEVDYSDMSVSPWEAYRARMLGG